MRLRFGGAGAGTVVPPARDPGGAGAVPAGGRRTGAALVLVLMVAWILGLAALTLVFTGSLDGLAARHVQQAAVAEAQAEGALALAAAALASESPDARAAMTSLGPWPRAGIGSTVSVIQDGNEVLRLVSRARVGSAATESSLAVSFPPDGSVVIRARP